MSDEITRRELLLSATGLTGGFAAAQYAKENANEALLGGGIGSQDHEVTIMPGKIKEHYYYPTISEFKSEVGEPNNFPAIVWTDSSAYAYDN